MQKHVSFTAVDDVFMILSISPNILKSRNLSYVADHLSLQHDVCYCIFKGVFLHVLRISVALRVSKYECRRDIEAVSSAGYLSAAAGLKAWVTEGRVGAGRLLQASTSGGQFQPGHLLTSSLAPLHLLRNWKIHK